MSDIPQFAEWEAHQSVKIAERQQPLLDLQDPDRVWEGADSSNDLRSEDELALEESGVELTASILDCKETITDPEALSLKKLQTSSTGKKDGITTMADPLDQFEVDPAQKEFLLEVLESGVAPQEEIQLLKQVQNGVMPKTSIVEMGSQPRAMVEKFGKEHLLKMRAQGGAEHMRQYAMDVYQYARAVGPQFGVIWAREKVIHNEAVFRHYLWSRGHSLSKDGVYTAFYQTDPKEGGDLIATLLLDDEAFWIELERLQAVYGGLTPGQKRKHSSLIVPTASVSAVDETSMASQKKRKGNDQQAVHSVVHQADSNADDPQKAEFKRLRKEKKKARRAQATASKAHADPSSVNSAVPGTTNNGEKLTVDSTQAVQPGRQQISSDSSAHKMKRKRKNGPIRSAYFETTAGASAPKATVEKVSPPVTNPSNKTVSLSVSVANTVLKSELSSRKVILSGDSSKEPGSKRARRRNKVAELAAKVQTPGSSNETQNTVQTSGDTEMTTDLAQLTGLEPATIDSKSRPVLPAAFVNEPVPGKIEKHGLKEAEVPGSVSSANGNKAHRKRKKNNNRLVEQPPKLVDASSYYPNLKANLEPKVLKKIIPAEKPANSSELSAKKDACTEAFVNSVGQTAPSKRKRNRKPKSDGDLTNSENVKMAERLANQKIGGTQPKVVAVKEKQQKKSPMELVAEALELEKNSQTAKSSPQLEKVEEPLPMKQDIQQANNIVMTNMDAVEAAGPVVEPLGTGSKAKVGRRSRGRKSRNKHEENGHKQGEAAPVTEQVSAKIDIDTKEPKAEQSLVSEPVAQLVQNTLESAVQEPVIPEPLSELADTNVKKPKGGRRSRKRKLDTLTAEGEAVNEDSTGGSHLLDIPSTQEKSENRESIPETSKESQNDDDTVTTAKTPTTPKSPACQVVVYTPSKAWVPPELHNNSTFAIGNTTGTGPDVYLNYNDNSSVFSMTQYGSMDWDHSGDEFDKIEVTSKPKRRTSSKATKLEFDGLDTNIGFATPKKEEKSEGLPQTNVEHPSLLDPSVSTRVLRSATKAKKPPAKSPYFTPPISPSKRGKAKAKKMSEDTAEDKNTPSPSKASPSRRPPGRIISCIPFPPLSAPYFGLIQEKLAPDPFRLLIAVTFLIRTHGKHAIPVFYDLMEKYPTPQSLVAANKEAIVPVIRHLGLQNQRALTYQTYAKIWLENPPAKDKRYAVRDYPTKGDGRDIRKDEILSDDDPRQAWEIGHMTQGPYAIDSWRIFCRDVCRGIATGWNGEGRNTIEGEGEAFQPEWMRVLPEDKELRAYLRWMWLKEGFEWDPFTGEKEVASEELMRAAIEGRISWDDKGGMRIIDDVAEPVNGDGGVKVEVKYGGFGE